MQLYDQLMQIAPSPVVAMNRAIAIAELDGPDVGLAALDGLPLDQYQPYHSTRADLLRRAGRTADAVDEYQQALAMTTNDAERRFLERRLAELDIATSYSTGSPISRNASRKAARRRRAIAGERCVTRPSPARPTSSTVSTTRGSASS